MGVDCKIMFTRSQTIILYLELFWVSEKITPEQQVVGTGQSKSRSEAVYLGHAYNG